MATSVPSAPAPSSNWMSRLYQRISRIDLNPETAFKKAIPPPTPRSVYFGEPLPEEAFTHKGRPKKEWTFASNQVLTAKYTIYNFIFKNLLEQFRRVANIFFLIVVILQFFPQFATISPGLAMLPLLVVLAITALKDGYEDVKRHQSDRFINRTKTRALIGGGWVNPNVTERKEQSFSAVWRALWGKYFGGKKRTSEKMRANLERRNTLRSQSQISMVDPLEPPADAPGGGTAPQTINENENLEAPKPGFANLDRPNTNLSGGRTLTRTGTGHSAFASEFETDQDGRILQNGRYLTPEEEAKYHAKKAPRWREKNWEDLSVGDFVYLKNNDSIPADIVICATSEEEDSCFIETKNLDGETNLKSRHAVPELAPILRTPLDCSRAEIRVDAEGRDTNMYRLNASVVLSDRFDRNGDPLRCPVTLNEILLRGCFLRNTEWVIGIVLMTGYDTKIIANSGNTPSKRGKVERQMNPMVYFNLFILAAMAVGCAIADSRIEHYFFDRQAYWEIGADQSDDNPNINGLVSFGNALITFQNIVPISLYISIEFVRTVQAYFIFDDHDIFYEKTGRRTTARSWNLSDDLGQIQYVFSDKTGTLTQNLMIYREMCVAGVVYSGEGAGDRMHSDVPMEKKTSESESDRSDKLKVDLEPGRKRTKGSSEGVAPFSDTAISAAIKNPKSEQGKALGMFFRCLALCHTVLTAQDANGVIEYKAQSPDEQALVQAAADVGFVFCGKERATLRIQCPESLELEAYELLTVLEFSSARKRMSVILRRGKDGQILVLTKGADSVIFERSAPGQEDLKDQTDDALEEFANKGLRTLCLAYKDLSNEDYEDWAHRYHEASVSLEQREEKMEDLASALERDLTLLGATAIEDRLQDGVPETIADLKRAGINVWVATGDKLETAIAIGYSTLLLSKEMNLVVVRGGEYGQPNSAYEQLKKAVERFFGGREALYSMEHQPPSDVDQEDGQEGQSRPSIHGRRSTVSQASLVGEDNGTRPGGYALVIDGAALGHALSEEFSKELLLYISTRCKSVICCRVSPLQKALIVKLIRDGLGVMTLAIGDGANDVSMIQAAHVGVGIAGEEGLQAVNSSDYAIAQFRYLKRLLLVHGHWSYYRNGNMIINFFYKEIINIGYLFWFQIYCAWSTTQAIDYVYLLFWNAFWTVAAVIGLGIFDRDVSDRVLMEVPELYRRGREGKYFGLQPFLWYMLDGTYQSVVLYFFTMYTYDMTTMRDDGFDVNLYEWTTTMAIASVLVANLFTGLETRAWTWWIFAAVWLGPVLIFVFAPIYAAFPPTLIWTYSYGNNHYLYYSMGFWFAGILCFVLCLLPRYVFKHIRTVYYPTDIDILRSVDKYDKNHDYIRDPRMPALRAAEEYGHDLPASSAQNGESDEEGLRPPNMVMHDLHPTASRASSTHYDMLTGRETPNRGYTFSGEEKQGRNKRKLTIKERLLPKSLKRKNKKDKKSEMMDGVEEDREGNEGQNLTQQNDDTRIRSTETTGSPTDESAEDHTFREMR